MTTSINRAGDESLQASPREAPAKLSATRMTFVLSVFCLAILGYSAIAYVHLSFHETSGALSIPLFVVRQRTALSALAMTVAITCIVMGFAVFMIGAKGEFNFKVDSTWARGALVSGVPGPFFVLCGAAITVTVLLVRVSYETGPGLQADQNDNSRTYALNASPSTAPPVASRTIASSPTQRIALYTAQTAVYNDLLSLALEDQPADAVKHIVTNQDQLSVVLLDWDPANQRPLSFEATDIDNRNTRLAVSDGYLFVLDHDNAETIKSLLKAAGSVAANFPSADHLSDQAIARIVKAALANRVVFSHGEPAH